MIPDVNFSKRSLCDMGSKRYAAGTDSRISGDEPGASSAATRILVESAAASENKETARNVIIVRSFPKATVRTAFKHNGPLLTGTCTFQAQFAFYIHSQSALTAVPG